MAFILDLRIDIRTKEMFVCLFVFVALRPKSTAMVIEGRSVHLTTLFSWACLNNVEYSIKHFYFIPAFF